MESYSENESKKAKCNLQEDGEDHPGNGMDNLPRDIALDILSRLPITSLIQFRVVSRAWNMLSHDTQLVNMHISRTANRSPYLILHCDYPLRNELYWVEFSDRNEEGRVRKIHVPFCGSMPEFNVVGSSNGLLCLSDSLFGDAIFVYNPFTGKYKELPKSRQYEEQEVMIGFGFHPVINEYKVVKMVYYRNAYVGPWRARSFRNYDCPHSEVQVLSLGRDVWRSIGNVPYQLERRSKAILVNGKLHWLSRAGRHYGVRGRIIISFDLADERFSEVPKPDCGGLNKCNYHLAVLGGCLAAAVYRPCPKYEIWVMKEYNLKESWIKQYSLGDYMPRLLNQALQQSFGIWRNILIERLATVLCLLKNGEILVEYRGGTLASYDPESGKFTNVMFHGMPNIFQTIVHIGSLNWIDVPIAILELESERFDRQVCDVAHFYTILGRIKCSQMLSK
ncbi:hypothetical protein RJ640_013588 [Escallonia rubra]|uniref:F-box domain-containing protein n=1 Tax=Escallonia rubra TaxID=112253 RepID=A0AA88S407_9ASTE|nr:hypothetical protein RJ640_013588 [Escallonia rubra]